MIGDVKWHFAAHLRTARLGLRARRCRGFPLLLLLVLGVSGCDRPERPNLLLITVDTLRADALRPYQSDALSHTPVMQRFADEATLYEHAAVPMPLTRPSHFSIFTSRHPREHGVLNNQINLPEGERVLAEILQEAGYRTGAVVAVKLLDRSSGAGQGFSDFAAPEKSIEWSAEQVVSKARAWLHEDASQRPFFLWVHFFDPHQPYDPPLDFRAGVDRELSRKFPSLSWPDFTAIARENGGEIPEAVLRHAEALYRGEVEATDYWLGELLGALAGHPRRDDTMVVVTSDHGECFEGGVYFEHSDCLYEGSVRVPLMVRYPQRFSSGRREADLVSTLDIAPTFLAAAGLDIPSHYSGRPLPNADSLPGPVAAAKGTGRHLLIQNPFYQSGVVPARMRRQVAIRRVGGEAVRDVAAGEQLVGVVAHEWKYLRGAKSEELYSLKPDGTEVRIHTRERPDLVESMRAQLDSALAEHPLELIAPSEINPELLRSLRALGYIE